MRIVVGGVVLVAAIVAIALMMNRKTPGEG